MPFVFLSQSAMADERLRYWQKLIPTKQTMLDLLETLLETGVQLVVVFLLYLALLQLVKRLMKRYLAPEKFETLYTVTQSFLKLCLYFIEISLFLYGVFHISLTSVIAVAGVGGIAIGFGAQSLVKDMITGLFILSEDQYRIGDIIEICGKAGTVEKVNLRTTRLRSANGDVHVIPNGEITLVTNMCKDFKRAVVEVRVSYKENIDHVMRVLQDEMNAYHAPHQTDNTPQVIGIVQFDEGAVVLRITCDCKPGQNWELERELRRLVKNRLDAENIQLAVHHVAVEVADAGVYAAESAPQNTPPEG